MVSATAARSTATPGGVDSGPGTVPGISKCFREASQEPCKVMTPTFYQGEAYDQRSDVTFPRSHSTDGRTQWPSHNHVRNEAPEVPLRVRELRVPRRNSEEPHSEGGWSPRIWREGRRPEFSNRLTVREAMAGLQSLGRSSPPVTQHALRGWPELQG